MDFGEALENLKVGNKVARKGWNGKGMFIYLTAGSEVPYEHLRGNCKKYLFGKRTPSKEGNVVINGHIDMYAADGTVVIGWLASQTDMLADDWEIVR